MALIPAPAIASPAATPVAVAALELRGLTVSYRHKPVLRHVNLSVPRGALTAIVGPNGAGKSTLLKATLGLTPIDSGEVRIMGRALRDARRLVAYVPQTDSTDWDFPVTVREVVLMGRYGRMGLFGRPGRLDDQCVRECLATVAMDAFVDRHIRQLSGGQQQRVFLARALAQEADLLLLDEPFSGVDARTETALFDLMEKFAANGKTLVLVNHNLHVLRRFDFVALLNQSIIAFGPPAEILTEHNLHRTYGGRMSFLDEAEQQLHEGPADVR